MKQSKNKRSTNNPRIQVLIAEILKPYPGMLTVSELTKKVNDKFDRQYNRKTIERNLFGMLDLFKMHTNEEENEHPRRFGMGDNIDPAFSITLSINDIQLLSYALRAFSGSAPKTLKPSLNQVETALLSTLPDSTKSELRYALKSYKTPSHVKESPSFKKNDVSKVFMAIRKKHWMTARVKDMSKSKASRHINQKIAVVNIWVENGLPWLHLYSENSDSYFDLKATSLNGISLTNEKVPAKVLRRPRD